MEEKKILIICLLVFLALGAILVYFSLFFSSFNFESSVLKIRGNNVEEVLNFIPNKAYHTLFRYFSSPVTVKSDYNNGVKIENVFCSAGEAYTKDFSGFCFDSSGNSKDCRSYTEQNEVGCTFGDSLGFVEGEEYILKANYVLNPAALIKIEEEYYIKFVAYSAGNHKLLVVGRNLIVEGAYSKKIYLPNEDVILYIPVNYTNEDTFLQDDFGFTNQLLTLIFIALIPSFLLFLSWLIFGRELIHTNIPEVLSQFPEKREAWEVASVFTPPFRGTLGRVFSATLLGFYDRKIIDIKIKKAFFGNDTYIKLNEKEGGKLKGIEKEIFSLLEEIKMLAKEEDGFFNLKIESGGFTKIMERAALKKKFRELSIELDENTKKYIDFKGVIFAGIAFFLFVVFSFFIGPWQFVVFAVINFILFLIVSTKSSLLLKFKGEYYAEYLKWKGFRRYLEGSVSMKEADSKAVVLWNHYLVYAVALGVPKKILKELRERGLIDERHYNASVGISASSASFFSSGAGGSSGGGMGGGGGVGGGGGGGR